MVVLLADDDGDFRRALARALVAEGFVVIEASDGERALETLAAAADGLGAMPDVVLLDVCMPGYSGLGVLRALRRFRLVPPILLLTGFADPSVDTIARNLGARRVFHKPIDLDEVVGAVLEATSA